MTKVEVFSTLREADEKLRTYFSHNLDVTHKVLTELQARNQVYQQSADFVRRHLGKSDNYFTVEELIILSKDLGKGEVITSLIKLYSINQHSYGFDHSMFDPKSYLHLEPQKTIAALAEKARQQVKENQESGHMGLETVSLFYTVLEPFTFSERTLKKARADTSYVKLSPKERSKVDDSLDNYVERGLTSEEIKDFITGYVKFLN